MRFRDNLKIYREKLPGKVSAKDFAKSLKIPYSTYLGYENKGTEPKYDTLCKIAAALHVTTDELLGYTLDEYEKCCSIIYEFGYDIVEEDTTIAIIPQDGCSKLCDYYSREEFINDIHKATQNYKEQTNAIMHNILHNIFIQAMFITARRTVEKAVGLNEEIQAEEKVKKIIDVALKEITKNQSATHPTKLPTKKATRRKK